MSLSMPMEVLIADDDEGSLNMLAEVLRRAGHSPVLAIDGSQAIAALDVEAPPRVAILDWNMPGKSGPDVCRWLRARGGPYVYVILLTGRHKMADLVTGLDSGADDFIVKPYQHEELRARLRAGERILAMHAELEKAHAMLRELAAHDLLTGLLNRGAILSHLDRDLARHACDGGGLSVLMVDFDHYKSVNDRFGHAAGDAALREAAARLKRALRGSDAIGRYGGDEFLVVLEGCDGQGAAVIAERLRAGIADTPIDLGASGQTVTCSFGLATLGEGAPCSAAELIALADGALSEAKRAGRNRVAVATGRAAPK